MEILLWVLAYLFVGFLIIGVLSYHGAFDDVWESDKTIVALTFFLFWGVLLPIAGITRGFGKYLKFTRNLSKKK